jgi:hypothetical protein
MFPWTVIGHVCEDLISEENWLYAVNARVVIHFEKANPRIEGLCQVINQWFCQKAVRNFRFVNREQDLGILGLRRAKQKLPPSPHG